MRTVFSATFLLACTFSVDAQITTILNRLPDGSTEIRMRNNSSVSLAAFAISVKYESQTPEIDAPIVVYLDPAIDTNLVIGIQAQQTLTGPLMPRQEFTLLAENMIAMNRRRGKPQFEQPVTAGIFTDGTTTGDADLLTRLMLRRSNMLLAVETTLEILSDAGRHNIPREQLIEQFRKLADSVRRWYLPREQRIGLGLYQSIIGKLMNLPEEQVGSPFPPVSFVTQETAMLIPQRATLLRSQPSLAAAGR